jgi:ribose 5-phosphate isomerase A
MLSQKEMKELVGKSAVDSLIDKGLLVSGMKLGLGTGSTAMPAVKRIAERIADGTLKNIKAVPTSFQTQIACENFGIPVFTLNAKEIAGSLDLAIDGADEITSEKFLIKGGGAAHLQEKLIEYNAKILVIVADESKKVLTLGTKFPLPVEVIPEGRVSVTAALEKLGAKCTVREGIKKAGPVITDNGNIIIDCIWEKPVDPVKMEMAINDIVGVIENGFFTKNIPICFISHADGTVENF